MIFVKNSGKEIEAKKNLYIEQNKIGLYSNNNKKTPGLFTVPESKQYFL